MPIHLLSVKKRTIIFLIYISFALDSFLKLDFDIQIHLGLFLILIANGFFFIKKPFSIFSSIRADFIFPFFLFYCVLSGFFISDSFYLGNTIYMFIALNVLVFCALTFKYWDDNFFYWFQILMLLTGFIQYFIYKFAGVQIAFIDSSHYEKLSSVAHRLRGFYIEPNWFAISLTFNTFLLFGRSPMAFAKKTPIVTFFTVMAMILNGTLTTLLILVLVYTIPLFKKNPFRALLLLVLIGSVFIGAVSFRSAINVKEADKSVVNLSSRITPFLRVIEYQIDNSRFNQLFGNGFGSWGTLAVENRLSALVHEQDPAVRDGSEVPVILFELGFVGVMLIFFDNLRVYLRIDSNDFHLRGAIILFCACLFLYPTFKFWMYMPYYFYIRRHSLCHL